jgi:hypothetical protein
MATKRRKPKSRKRRSRRSRRRSCKYGKLKRPTKTKSGRKRRCKKKRSKRKGKKRSKKRSKRKGKKRSNKMDGLPTYTDIGTLPPQYYAPELERVMNRNNMLSDLLERTQKTCTDQIAQLRYDNQVLEQELAYGMYQQQPAQEGQGYAYVSEDEDEDDGRIMRENVDRENDGNLGGVRTRLFEEDDQPDASGDDFMQGIQQGHFQERDNLPNVISDPNVGDQGNLQDYEFGENWALNDSFLTYQGIEFSNNFLSLLLGSMMMSSELSDVSRCAKLLMILCLDIIMYKNSEIGGEMNLWSNWIKPNNYANLIDLINKCKTVLQAYRNDPYISDPQIISVDVGQATGLTSKIENIEINAELVNDICKL